MIKESRGIRPGRKENMGTYREWIESLKKEWIGKRVKFEGNNYKVVDVDYNGMLLIDKKAQYTETTAIPQYAAEKINP